MGENEKEREWKSIYKEREGDTNKNVNNCLYIWIKHKRREGKKIKER